MRRIFEYSKYKMKKMPRCNIKGSENVMEKEQDKQVAACS